MDLNKKTKTELLEIIINQAKAEKALTSKVLDLEREKENTKHLKTTVEAKDERITNLDKENGDLKIGIKKLQQELENYKHMKTSLEAKDLKIVELNTKSNVYEKKNNELEKELNNYKHMKTSLENKDLKIVELNKKLESQRKEITEELEKVYKTQINNIYKTLEKREQEINKILIAGGNLLKGLQGQLDNAILVNEYLVKEINE